MTKTTVNTAVLKRSIRIWTLRRTFTTNKERKIIKMKEKKENQTKKEERLNNVNNSHGNVRSRIMIMLRVYKFI